MVEGKDGKLEPKMEYKWLLNEKMYIPSGIAELIESDDTLSEVSDGSLDELKGIGYDMLTVRNIEKLSHSYYR